MTTLSACKHGLASLLINNIKLPLTEQALRMAIEQEEGIEAVREIERDCLNRDLGGLNGLSGLHSNDIKDSSRLVISTEPSERSEQASGEIELGI